MFGSDPFFVLNFGLTFGFKLRYRFLFVPTLCSVQVHLIVRFGLKFGFMFTKKYGFIFVLHSCFGSYQFSHNIYAQFGFIFVLDSL